MGLITLGPDGFAAYGRLRFTRDPSADSEAEADVELPADHPTDLTQARRALNHLAPFTTTPQDIFLCVWDGYSDMPTSAQLSAGATVRLPDRQYVLMRGEPADLAAWDSPNPPAFIWPADRAWCFTSDVDPHWAGIGATTAAIDALVDADDVDVVRVQPGEDLPRYRN